MSVLNLDPEYKQHDISSEEWRDIAFPNGYTYRICNPVVLIIRRGGSTHRVIDSEGVVHCYAAPEIGQCVVSWKGKQGLPPVAF